METTADDDLIASAMDQLDKPQPLTPHASAQAAPPSLVPAIPSIASPTLEKLAATRRPLHKTVCEGCPNSVWFSSPSEVKCYCRVMYLVTWSTKEPNQITGCDGIFIGQDD